MTFETMILDKLNSIEAQMSALIVFQIIFAMILVYFMYDMRNRHTIQNLAKTGYQFLVKKADRLKLKKKMGGMDSRPDALPLLEKYVAEYWISTKPRIMEFTESVWLPIIRNGNFTRPDWKPLTERWKALGIITQKDPTAKTGKGTALVAAKGEIGMERKMILIRSTSPAPDVNMPEMDKSAG